MSSTERLPLLPLDDAVVLPGMAVPVELSDAEARVAVERRAPTSDDARPARPALDGRYAAVGTVAVVEQVGRLPGGEPAARGARHRPGPGSAPAPPAPAAALWVEATPRPDEHAVTAQAQRAGPRVQGPGQPRSCSSAAPGR